MKTNFSIAFVLIFFAFILSCQKNSNTPHQIKSGNDPDNLKLFDPSLSQGLIAYFPFNGNLNDSSGNGNNATSVGDISFTSDRFNDSDKAVLFSGGRIDIPQEQFLGLQQYSISIDFFPMLANVHAVLIGKRQYQNDHQNSNGKQSFNLGIYEQGHLEQFQIRNPGTCDEKEVLHNPLLTDSAILINQWNHIAATYDGTTQKIYVNGKLAGQQTVSGSLICTGSYIRLGVWWQGDKQPFKGKMDEVRIYNRALSASEVAALSTK